MSLHITTAALLTATAVSIALPLLSPTTGRAAVAVAAPQANVNRDLSGYQFSLPSGWKTTVAPNGAVVLSFGGMFETEGYVMIVSPSPVAGGAASNVQLVEKAEAEIGKMVPGLRRTGTVTTLATGCGSGIRFDWTGSGASGQSISARMFMVTHNNMVVTLMAVGPQGVTETRYGQLQNLFASLKPDAAAASNAAASPLAQQWTNRLRGQKLTVLSQYSSGMSGGMSKRADLSLFASGQFHYRDESLVSINVEGLGGSSGGRHEGVGTWRITASNGVALLELKAQGQTQTFRLDMRDNKTLLNGTRAFVTPL